MGPVRQKPIQRPVRSIHVCALHCAQLYRTTCVSWHWKWKIWWEQSFTVVGYSKENLKIHTGVPSLPFSSPPVPSSALFPPLPSPPYPPLPLPASIPLY